MDTPAPALQPRGIDVSLPTCEQTQCNSHGECVAPPGGGTDLVCDCHLGYQGEFCDDTVNGALSLPLTLSVIAVIIGLLILAFIIAKMRQRQKKNRRVTMEDYYLNVHVLNMELKAGCHDAATTMLHSGDGDIRQQNMATTLLFDGHKSVSEVNHGIVNNGTTEFPSAFLYSVLQHSFSMNRKGKQIYFSTLLADLRLLPYDYPAVSQRLKY